MSSLLSIWDSKCALYKCIDPPESIIKKTTILSALDLAMLKPLRHRLVPAVAMFSTGTAPAIILLSAPSAKHMD